jgi:hypothetical protein
MVGRIESDAKPGLVSGVHYYREFRWRFPAGAKRRRRRLCDRDAPAVAELGRSSPSRRAGQQLGPGLTAQANQAVWGTMEEEVRWYKGPPSLAITEHWNYEDHGKDFFGGYCL